MSELRDSFSQFLNDAGRIPLLTHEEEITLAREVQRWLEIRDLDPGDDPALRRKQKRGRKAYERFFTANIRMVISIARRYTAIARELTIDDLTMEGMVGLSRAIELFDPTRGYKFSTYAFNWIRQSISRSVSHFDRSIRLPVNGIERLSKLGKWLPVFKAEQGRSPTLKEMAEYAECTVPTLEAYMQHTQRVISLDLPTGSDRPGDGPDSFLADLIPDGAMDSTEELQGAELRAEIDLLLAELPPHQTSLIRDHFGFDKPEMSMVQIAADWGCNRNSIWERKVKAFGHLEKTMLPLWRAMQD